MKYFIFLTLISLPFICTASQLEEIKIIGNEHTRNSIIEREIHHTIPAEFDSSLAQKDRDRIYNLGIFSTVEIYQVDSAYTVFLVETFRVLPIPIVTYEEGKGLSYGAGIAYMNIRGLDEQLIFGGIGGQETTFFFDFNDPWVYGDHGSFKGKFYQFYTHSGVYNYSYLERDILTGTGFYIGERHKFKFEFGIEDIILDTVSTDNQDYEKYALIDFSKNHKYIRGLASYKYDTRDIYTDPTKGERFTMKLVPKMGQDGTASLINLKITYKKYAESKYKIIHRSRP